MPTKMQFNLPLLEAPAAVLPDDKRRELALALVEMLIGAARESVRHPAQGGRDES
jgi:hypothetical protein